MTLLMPKIRPNTHLTLHVQQAAAYFANFEISKSTTNHSCTLMKKAQKSKNGPKIAQFEVAPSCQNLGNSLIKVENENDGKAFKIATFT